MNNKELIHELRMCVSEELCDLAADALETAERKLAIAVEALRMAEHTEDCAAICGPENETWIEHSRCNCCIGKALAQIMGET